MNRKERIEASVYVADMGRPLVDAEFDQAAAKATPVWLIKQGYCREGTENSRYSVGRRGRN